MGIVVLYCTWQLQSTNKLIANAIASFVFAFIVIDTAVALLRAQNAERQEYLKSKCWQDEIWGCRRIYLFDFLDGEILSYSASGVALVGVGLGSIVLNRNPKQNPKANIAMYALSVSLFGVYVVYYNTFSYAQYYWWGMPDSMIPLKNVIPLYF